jgi:integrase
MLHLMLPEPPRHLQLKSSTKQGRVAILRALEGTNVRAKITPELIKALPPPLDRHEAFVWCTEVKGWGIRILRSGTASWVTQARVRGQSISRRNTFGRVDRLPFTLARERAKEILALAELGRDWYAEQAAKAATEQAAKDAETVDSSLGARLEDYLADPATKALRTYDTAARYLRRVWAPLHAEPAETITSKDITRELEKIAVDRGTVAANRARSKLHSAFEWLLATHRLERDDNPAARARKWKEARKRNRAPSLQELGAIWKAAGECWPDSFGAAVRLLILTAARKSEVALLGKSEVDLEGAEIVLPPARTKAGEWHMIPLSRPAVRILRYLPERRSARIFPVVSWARCKTKLDERSGVEGWTLHDLRRSFSSLARDELHADGEVVELALGHLPPGVRGRYDFSQRKAQRRDLAEAWARLVLKAAGEPVDQPALRVVEGGGR